MEKNTQWFYQMRAQAVIEALEKNRMSGVYVPEASQAAEKVLSQIPAGSSVGLGGSMTLVQTGIIEGLRQGDFALIDRFEKGLSPEEAFERQRLGLVADVFVSGVNAVTEQGELIFVDATCNRVAPILFGPTKVILVSGCNKIVPNLAYAQERIRHYVAPTNARRLGRDTPCAKDGQCRDCKSPERICNATVVIHKQADPNRLNLVLVGEDLGL
ncbi:MAG: lactate utilization protein [Desulfarculaceae bacterium]|jgi:hypothetical protein